MSKGPHAGGEHGSSQPDRAALVRYTLIWLGAAVAVVSLALLVFDDGDAGVSLPPIRQTELTDAARAAGCELRGGAESAGPSPPATAPPARPAEAGIYTRALDRAALLAAVRRGIVVIEYRRSIGDDRIEELQTVQRVLPAGTIIAPAAGTPHAVTVTAWRRLLACRRMNAVTIDAIRLFRGRFVGTGPDAEPAARR